MTGITGKVEEKKKLQIHKLKYWMLIFQWLFFPSDLNPLKNKMEKAINTSLSPWWKGFLRSSPFTEIHIISSSLFPFLTRPFFFNKCFFVFFLLKLRDTFFILLDYSNVSRYHDKKYTFRFWLRSLEFEYFFWKNNGRAYLSEDGRLMTSANQPTNSHQSAYLARGSKIISAPRDDEYPIIFFRVQSRNVRPPWDLSYYLTEHFHNFRGSKSGYKLALCSQETLFDR